MRIFLVGYMGSGKTKTAEALSKIFKYKAVDTDKLVVEKTGKTISSVFEIEGQEFFRDIERDVLRTTAKSDNIIVSTGGGTPCYFDNMKWMNENGITIYIEANSGLLFHRLATSKAGRPLIEKLNDIELMEQITGHLAVRVPVYKQSNIIVNALSVDVKMLAEKIKNFSKTGSA
jgi:shikimate kinase